MLRSALLAMGRSRGAKRLLMAVPATRRVVSRFVSGETMDECLTVVRGLVDRGLAVTIDFLGEDTTNARQADRVTDTYVELLRRLAAADLTGRVEVSVKLSALGSQLTRGRELALDNAQLICEAAAAAGTTVTVDAEDHKTTDATLRTVADLRVTHPWVGAVVQAYLHRTPDDCTKLTGPGSRVRLCKGAYAEPRSVAVQGRRATEAAYLRCLDVLMRGQGVPLVATHDPRLIGAALTLADRLGRDKSSFELQMLYGIRAGEQARLAGEGYTVRVYVPFGSDWYAYFMRRLAERPANLRFFLRALAAREPKAVATPRRARPKTAKRGRRRRG